MFLYNKQIYNNNNTICEVQQQFKVIFWNMCQYMHTFLTFYSNTCMQYTVYKYSITNVSPEFKLLLSTKLLTVGLQLNILNMDKNYP